MGDFRQCSPISSKHTLEKTRCPQEYWLIHLSHYHHSGTEASPWCQDELWLKAGHSKCSRFSRGQRTHDWTHPTRRPMLVLQPSTSPCHPAQLLATEAPIGEQSSVSKDFVTSLPPSTTILCKGSVFPPGK